MHEYVQSAASEGFEAEPSSFILESRKQLSKRIDKLVHRGFLLNKAAKIYLILFIVLAACGAAGAVFGIINNLAVITVAAVFLVGLSLLFLRTFASNHYRLKVFDVVFDCFEMSPTLMLSEEKELNLIKLMCGLLDSFDSKCPTSIVVNSLYGFGVYIQSLSLQVCDEFIENHNIFDKVI